MRMLRAALVVAALTVAVMVAGVAHADVVEIRALGASEVTVGTDDYVYMATGWIDAYKPRAVLDASRWLEYEFCVYGPEGGAPLYCGETSDGTWSDVALWTGADDPLTYWHPTWPHESFYIEWTYDFGYMAAGDYEVVFDTYQTRPLMSWADIDNDGRPDVAPPSTFGNNFIIHVVED